MRLVLYDDGGFSFEFRAGEGDVGLNILESLEPTSEEDEAKIQRSIDDLLAHNDLSQYRTIN